MSCNNDEAEICCHVDECPHTAESAGVPNHSQCAQLLNKY